MRIRGLLVLLGATLVCAEGVGDRFIEQEQRAFARVAAKEYEAAIAAFEKQIAIFPESPRPYYNIACCYALTGDAERATTWLELAVRHGWRNARHLDEDGDFAGIRTSPEFRRVRARLDRVPPILPKRVDPASVPPASSAARILADGELALARLELELDERLWEPMQIRAKLFAHFDRQMARLVRYIDENGDARDAHLAGRERVKVAGLYWMQAEEGSQLERVARTYVSLTADEFIERWPTSPHLFQVQFWRAEIGGHPDAIPQIAADAPKGDAAARAIAHMLERDPSTRERLFASWMRDYADTPVGRQLLTWGLWRIRLQVEGLPEGLRFDPPIAKPREGRLVIGIVTAEDHGKVPDYAGDRLALIVLGDEPWTGRKTPLAKNPLDAARRLGVADTPIFLIFEEGKLVGPNSLLSRD